MSKKQPDLHKRIVVLEKEIAELRATCEKHLRERARLASLYVLWKKSALRYQKIAAALSHAYYTSHVLYSDEYGADVMDSHAEVRLAS